MDIITTIHPTTPVRYTYCWHSFPRSHIIMNFHLKLHSFPYTLVWLSFVHVCVASSSVGIRHQTRGFQINLVDFLFQRKCNLPNKAFLRSSFDFRTKNKRNNFYGWCLIFLKLDPCLDLQKADLNIELLTPWESLSSACVCIIFFLLLM